VPIESPSRGEIIGAMILWGVTSVDFDTAIHAPIHVAVRLAALAIADSRTKRELRWAASHDPLTGLVNRAEFGRLLDAVAGADIVLLYIDLDDFKPINDVYGHPVGDTVLVEVGRRMSAVLGDRDFVGRLGGDEFAVVCGTGDLDYGRAVADRIVAEISRPIVANGVTVRVGASVGLAVGAQPLIPAVLVQKADEALYAAKNSGKNTVRVAN
jgi:diguanylate cyclase (GGDEF)-like protein